MAVPSGFLFYDRQALGGGSPVTPPFDGNESIDFAWYLPKKRNRPLAMQSGSADISYHSNKSALTAKARSILSSEQVSWLVGRFIGRLCPSIVRCLRLSFPLTVAGPQRIFTAFPANCDQAGHLDDDDIRQLP
jgi:hypothetical protein